MSEWLKEHAWKACVGETLPWVRIPLSPPSFAKRSLRSRLRMAGHVTRTLAKDALRSGHGREGGRLTAYQLLTLCASHMVDPANLLEPRCSFEGDFGCDCGVTFAPLGDVPSEEARFVYILRSSTDPSRRYIGLTSDIGARLHAHNAGQNSSTALWKPWVVDVCIEFRDATVARRFERYLKSGSGHTFARRHF